MENGISVSESYGCYNAIVDGLSKLYNGRELTIIPDKAGMSINKLSVNGSEYVDLTAGCEDGEYRNLNEVEIMPGFPQKYIYVVSEKNGEVVERWVLEPVLSASLLKNIKENGLPITYGGTGAKNVMQARRNIETAPISALNRSGELIDINELTEPGYYYCTDIKNSPISEGLLIVEEVDLVDDNNKIFSQKILNNNILICARSALNIEGSFEGVEWEYENPDPVWLAGAGYGQVVKTTERFRGKPVYTTVFGIDKFEKGQVINISGDITVTGIEGQVIRHEGILRGNFESLGSLGGTVEYKTLPYICGTYDNPHSAWLNFETVYNKGEGHKIRVVMLGDNSNVENSNGDVQIWFVKPDLR